jgi:hypothetical protein
MSQATAEEIAAENEFQERLLMAVLEPLTNLPLGDLQHWHFRQSIFTHLDKHIDTVIECSRGRENVARHHLILMLFKIINRLLGEIDAGQTDAQYEREAMARITGVAPAANKPVKTLGRSTKYYHAKRAKMTEAELAADRAKRAAVMREIRAKRKAARTGENAVNGLHQGIRPKYPGS